MNNGSEVSMVVSSADASGGVAFDIFRMPGGAEETIAGTRRVCITDIIATSTAGEDMTIAGDSSAAHSGANLVARIITETGALTFAHHFSTPYQCKPGKTPELICSAGQVDVTMMGYLMDA